MEEQNKINQDTTGNRTDTLRKSTDEVRRHLATKSVMLLVIGIVVVVTLAALGIAWYTRVANSYSVSFEIADYDLAVNNNGESGFMLNVYDYSQVTEKRFAPGAIGWLPLDISAEYSQTNVQFSISISNNMPNEIGKHFRAFVLCSDIETDEETGATTYTYLYGEALEHEADIANYEKVYLDDGRAITDSIEKGTTKKLCIYWEWYLDAYRANADHTETDANGNKTFMFYLADGTLKRWQNLSDEERAGVVSRWDSVDTDMGRYPAKYKDSLVLGLYVSGAQIQPSDGQQVTTVEETTSEVQTTGEVQTTTGGSGQ